MNSKKTLKTMLVLIIFAIIAIYGPYIYQSQKASEQRENANAVKRREALLNELKDLLHTGKTSTIRLYSSEQTDELILGLSGNSSVETLVLQLTDISEVGVGELVTFPNLKELTTYGGKHPMTDTELAQLKGCQSLEILRIINTHVTDAGLFALRDFPQLRNLTLFQEANVARMTDKAVYPLADLERLKRLTIAGGWMTENGIAELKKKRPDCEIIIRPDVNDDEW